MAIQLPQSVEEQQRSIQLELMHVTIASHCLGGLVNNLDSDIEIKQKAKRALKYADALMEGYGMKVVRKEG